MYYNSAAVYVFFCMLSIDLVVATIPSATLNCNASGLTLTFNKTELEGSNRNYTIKFKDQESTASCMINHGSTDHIDGTRIWIQADYNKCGIEASEEEDKIVYNQTVVVTYGNDANSLIFRHEDDEYNVHCEKSRKFTKSLDVFNVTKKNGRTTNKVGNTSFEIDLGRYPDDGFNATDVKNTLTLGSTFYFQLQLKTSRSDIIMSPQNCYATKSDGTGKYFLIKDRCVNKDDGTVKILTTVSDNTTFQWQNEAFRYFGSSDEIYIHCDVLICAGTTNGNCQRCNSVNKRKRRDLSTDLNGNVQVVGTTKQVGVTSSLIVLVDGRQGSTPNNNNAGEPSSVFAGIKGTIIIVLMAVFVLIVAVAVVKKVFLTKSTTTTVAPISLKVIEGGYINKAVE